MSKYLNSLYIKNTAYFATPITLGPYNDNAYVINTNNSASNTYSLAKFNNSTDSTTAYTGLGSSTNPGTGGIAGAAVLYTPGAYPVILGTNNTSRLTINSIGVVNISNTIETTSPTTGALIVSGGIVGNDVLISNRMGPLGYMYNSAITGSPIYTSLKVLNKRTRVSRAAAKKSLTNTWYTRSSPISGINHVFWSPELSLFVGATNAGNSIVTSSDGITWTSRTVPSGYTTHYSVCWSSELNLFAMGCDGSPSDEAIITSPDGITWIARSTPAGFDQCMGVCFSPELSMFVATSQTSPYIIYSNNGTVWSSSTVAGQCSAVCWSPELKLFVAQGDGTTYTSSNGTTWATGSALNTTISTTSFNGLCWSPELYMFVMANEYSGDAILYTSPDGLIWTMRINPGVSSFKSCIWVPELSIVAVINGAFLYYSFNGAEWTTIPAGDANNSSISWSPELSIFAICVQTSSAIYTSTPALPSSLNTIRGPSSQLYLNPSNGFLGISQSSPAYQLDVTGTSRLTGIMLLTANVASTTTTTGTLVITGGLGVSGNITASKFTTSNATNYSPSTHTVTTANNFVLDEYFNSANSSTVYVGVGNSSFPTGGAAGAAVLYSANAFPLMLGTNLTTRLTINSAGAITMTGSLTLNGTVSNGMFMYANAIGEENSIRIYTGTSGTPGALWALGTNVTSGASGNTVFNLYNSVTSNILIARTTGQLELPINISSTSTTTGTLVVAGGVGIAGDTYIGGGLISLTNGTSNFINFGTVGIAAPAFTTRSAGTKIVLNSGISASTVDYALGIETDTLWYSVPALADKHLWYAATTQLMNLSGDGRLSIASASQPTYTSGAYISRLFLTGTAGSLNGPHIMATVSTDTYPVFHQLNWSHDNIAITFDAYFDLTWRYGHTSTPFQIYKVSSALQFIYGVTGTAGNAVSWLTAMFINSSGSIVIGSSTSATFSSAGLLSVANTTDSSSVSTGSINTLGGMGITKKLYVGTDVNLATVSGITTIGSTTAATFSAAGILTINNTTSTTSPTTGVLIASGGIACTDVVISNRVGSLGYMYNSTSTGSAIYTSLKVLNKRTRVSRAAAKKSLTNTWYTRSSPISGINHVCWSPELSLFVGATNTGDSIVTSSDGITWASRTVPSGYTTHYSVCWSSELNLFAMGCDGSPSDEAIITSPDGITWIARSTPAGFDQCMGVCFSPELSMFVATSQTSPYIIYSSDGTTWSSSTVAGQCSAVCWSPELKLFVAQGVNTTYTSSNGTTWATGSALNTTISTTSFNGLCWSPELYMFVMANEYSGDAILYTSPDGLIWTMRINPGVSSFKSCIWVPELSIVAVINGAFLYYSFNGVDWANTSVGDANNSSIAWSPELSIFAICVRDSSAVYTSTPALPSSLNTIRGPSSQLYLNPSNGFLGINQSSPAYQLDVTGTSRLTGIMLLTANVASTTTTTGTLVVTGGLGVSGNITAASLTLSSTTNFIPIISTVTTANNYNLTQYINSGDSSTVYVGVGSSSIPAGGSAGAAVLYSAGAFPLILGTNAAARLTINSAGAITMTGSLTLNGTVSNGMFMYANAIGEENSIRIYTGTSGTPGALWALGTNVTSGASGNTVFNLYNSVTSNILIARTTGQLELPINISSTSTTTGTLVVAGGVGIAGDTYIGGGLISLTNGTSNFINFGTVGIAAPAFTTRSAGTKIVLNSGISASTVDYALGIETDTLWYSVPALAGKHLWYAATTQLMNLSGDGRLSIASASQPTYTSGVYISKLFLTGAAGSLNGPHIMATTSQDNFPVFHQLNWSHDNIAINFDAYFDLTWRYGHTSTPFQIYKVSNGLQFNYGVTGTAGTAVSWLTAMTINSSGTIVIGSSTQATFSAAGLLSVANVTDSSSISTGSINTLGGMGITKKLYVGTDVNLATVSGITTIGSTTAATFSAAGILTINNTTSTTSPTTGVLIASGGIACTDVVISNRVGSLGYMYNSTSTGSAIYTSLKVLNKRTRVSRATAKKSLTNTWYTRSSPISGANHVCWSPELSLFVGATDSGNSIVTSSDGITWTSRTVPSGHEFRQSVCWSSELNLFVMGCDGSFINESIITSPDGITWTARSTPAGFDMCMGVCFSPELLLFVATSQSSPYIIYSSDGTTWSSATVANQCSAVCWSPELKLFVAQGVNTTYTSSNGTTWATGSVVNTSIFTTSLNGLCWSPELYMFVMANEYSGGIIHTSPDGINWTTRLSPGGAAFNSCIWVPELSIVAVIKGATVYYSFNGVDWSNVAVGDSNNRGLAWSPELNVFSILVYTSSAVYTSTPALPSSLNTIKGPSSQIYLNPSNGFLGINQSSPSYQLDVTGTSRLTGIMLLTANVTSSSTTTGSLVITGGLGVSGNIYLGGTLNVGTKNITPNTDDITSQITFTGANNQVAAANVTSLAFVNANTRSFKVQMSVVIIATASLYAQFDLNGVQNATDWYISQGYVGNDTSIVFSITSGGQIQYTSISYAGFVSLTMKFKAQVINL